MTLDSAHVLVPDVPSPAWTGQPAHDRARIARNDRGRVAGNVRGDSARPLAFSITQRELYRRSKKAFRDFAGKGPGAAKKVADALECSEKTAQNYLDGRNAPGGIYDLRALHAVPHYAAMKREISEMEMNLDPRLQAKLAEFARAMALYGQNLFGGQEEAS